jgi:flagellin
MSLSIQTNVNALVAQQNLSVNSQFQSRTIQRLTSGYRINSSSDDAAGLSVANKYRSDTAELNQGVRNANDGVSQLQIIDGGLSNISQMLDRLKTLATESASSTFTGDRSTLNNEYQSLLSEINRQAQNIKLDTNGSNATDMKVYLGGGNSTNAVNSNAMVSVDLSTSHVDSNGLGISGTSVQGGGVEFASATNARLDNPASVFSASQNFTVNYLDSNGVAQSTTVSYTGSVSTTGANVVSQLNSSLSSKNLGITAQIGSDGMLQFVGSNPFTIQTTGTANGAVDNAGHTAMSIVNSGVYNASGARAFTAYSNGTGTSPTDTVQYTDSNGKSVNFTFNATTASSVDTAVSNLNTTFEQAGVNIRALKNGNTLTLQSSGGLFTANETSSAAATGTGAGDAGFGSAAQALGAYTAPTITNSASATGNATSAIDAITAAVASLGTVQGKIGAGENMLNYAISLAQSQITNFSSAESQIRDADVASEAANLTKAQVLQQASIAAMAQANSAPQAVLSLLKG